MTFRSRLQPKDPSARERERERFVILATDGNEYGCEAIAFGGAPKSFRGGLLRWNKATNQVSREGFPNKGSKPRQKKGRFILRDEFRGKERDKKKTSCPC